ncbi:hypothetical protein [Streptomyces sp. x-80]|uniref:hypothetical protein n=1 Tax=Streptomyces sp. x-80 TaxID=2789282 RepID=UPI00397FA544
MPQLPPEPACTHVEALRCLGSQGRVHEAMPLGSGLVDRARGLTADAFAPAGDGIRGHFPRDYLAALEKNLT